jgi:putative nucleotidyltransferase with HDIG domain
MLLQGETARELAALYREQGRNRQTLQRLNQAHRLFAQLRARREMADVDRRNAMLESDFLEVVRKWGESIESKDMYTQGHCERVADLACALWARVAEGDATSHFWFRIGALLHDVGKLMVPAEVLNKPGRLDEAEWALVRRHPTAGVELLADIEFPWDVRPIVESHHERWDGAGYPHGVAGEAIPLTARVLCIADVYDALTSQRSYKNPFSHDEAMELMRKDVGRAFDPALFAHFEEVVRHGEWLEAEPANATAGAA